MENQLLILNGNFVKNGEIIHPEIGNKEQIAVLKKHILLKEEYKKGFLVQPEIISTYNLEASITCICSNELFFEQEVESKYFFEKEVKNSTINCNKCKRNYFISGSHEGKLIIKEK